MNVILIFSSSTKFSLMPGTFSWNYWKFVILNMFQSYGKYMPQEKLKQQITNEPKWNKKIENHCIRQLFDVINRTFSNINIILCIFSFHCEIELTLYTYTYIIYISE